MKIIFLFFVTAIQTGTWCGAGCAVCSTMAYCQACGPGYQISSTSKKFNCVSSSIAISNCKRNDTSGKNYCLECNDGYGLTDSILYSKICAACGVSNCLNCDKNQAICRVCSNGKLRDNGTCTSSSIETCNSNITNCNDCNIDSPSQCADCKDNYALSSTGTCVACPTGCKKCYVAYGQTSTTTCKECDVAGQYWMNYRGRCVNSSYVDITTNISPSTFGQGEVITPL